MKKFKCPLLSIRLTVPTLLFLIALASGLFWCVFFLCISVFGYPGVYQYYHVAKTTMIIAAAVMVATLYFSVEGQRSEPHR